MYPMNIQYKKAMFLAMSNVDCLVLAIPAGKTSLIDTVYLLKNVGFFKEQK